MSILIKGMEMPHNCFLCPLSVMNGERVYCEVTKDEVLRAKIAQDCPLIELPPHGRLIDADALMETFRERKRPTLSDGEDGSKERVRYINFISTLQAIKDAPAIIPAEEGE